MTQGLQAVSKLREASKVRLDRMYRHGGMINGSEKRSGFLYLRALLRLAALHCPWSLDVLSLVDIATGSTTSSGCGQWAHPISKRLYRRPGAPTCSQLTPAFTAIYYVKEHRSTEIPLCTRLLNLKLENALPVLPVRSRGSPSA